MRDALAAAGRYLTRFEELVSKTLLAFLVLLVFVPAVTRSFNRPIIWSIEIAQLLFAWLAFLGANQAMRAGAHIGVDVLTRHLPPRLHQAVAVFNLGLIAAFLAALLWYGIELTFVSVDRRFMTTYLSFAFATVAAPLGAGLLLLTTAGKVAEILRTGPRTGAAGAGAGSADAGETRSGPGGEPAPDGGGPGGEAGGLTGDQAANAAPDRLRGPAGRPPPGNGG